MNDRLYTVPVRAGTEYLEGRLNHDCTHVARSASVGFLTWRPTRLTSAVRLCGPRPDDACTTCVLLAPGNATGALA